MDNLIKNTKGNIDWISSVKEKRKIIYIIKDTTYEIILNRLCENDRHRVYVMYGDIEILKSHTALTKGFIKDILDYTMSIQKRYHKSNYLPKTNYYVYCHINKRNQKMYVGITSLFPSDRWLSGRGYDEQVFGKAIKKYGWNNFDHIILFNNLTKEVAETVEIELIKKYKTQSSNYGYNISPGGESYIRSDEHRKQLSDKLKGRKLTKEWLEHRTIAQTGLKRSVDTCQKIRESRSTPIICINTRKVYSSLTEAGNSTKTSIGHISQCCNKKRDFAGKDKDGNLLHWMLYDEYLNNNYINISNEEIIPNRNNIKRNWFNIIDKKTNKVYRSIRSACIENNITYEEIKQDLNTASIRWKYYTQENEVSYA